MALAYLTRGAHDVSGDRYLTVLGGGALGARRALSWLVTSSALKSCGRSLGHNPWTQSFCALSSGRLCGVVVASLIERMT